MKRCRLPALMEGKEKNGQVRSKRRRDNQFLRKPERGKGPREMSELISKKKERRGIVHARASWGRTSSLAPDMRKGGERGIDTSS